MMEWKQGQILCENRSQPEDLTESDTITALTFNHNGEFLAVGDKGGRVLLFNKTTASSSEQTQHVRAASLDHDKDDKKNKDKNKKKDKEKDKDKEDEIPIKYKPFFEFKSHDPEFDYLKSLEIEEKINKIIFCKPTNNCQLLLSTNDKTIKLWDTINGNCVKTLIGHTSGICSMIRLSDGRIASGSNDKTIILWDSSGNLLQYLIGHTSGVFSLIELADGKIASGSGDFTIRLWK